LRITLCTNMRRYRHVCVCCVGWSARNDGGYAYFHIVTAGPTSVQVCAPFISFPLPTHSKIKHVTNKTHSGMIITDLYTTKSLHERDPGYNGFQQLKWVGVLVRKGLVHCRHSFSHQFPISSTTFLPIIHPTPTSNPSSYSFPLFYDRSPTKHSSTDSASTHLTANKVHSTQ
jgi:hypothetical protein